MACSELQRAIENPLFARTEGRPLSRRSQRLG
ncbi:BnaA08g05800D [Brassica napus]|uniref:BnaA08g05800D protein n=1 Tax=Brassica napus TaxID=3708 RepID=A0A078G8H4_BRANA|nr:BnaA08g05800D [Brassica napus]